MAHEKYEGTKKMQRKDCVIKPFRVFRGQCIT